MRYSSEPARNWDRIVERVRMTQGMSEFLRRRNFASLSTACAEGPVVIVNVTQWRSDALIVTTQGVRTVPLPNLEFDEANRRADKLIRILNRVDRADYLLGRAQHNPSCCGS